MDSSVTKDWNINSLSRTMGVWSGSKVTGSVMEGNTNELQSRKDEWRKGNFRGIADLWKYNNEECSINTRKMQSFWPKFFCEQKLISSQIFVLPYMI